MKKYTYIECLERDFQYILNEDAAKGLKLHSFNCYYDGSHYRISAVMEEDVP